MTTASNIHPFTEWAKSRLDEIDAALCVFESKVEDVEAEARKQADVAIANMKNRRAVFKAKLKKECDNDAKAWAATNAQLEAEWHAFEDDVEAYWKSVGDKAGNYEDTFKAQAAAQQKAWHDTADRIKTAVETFQSDQKSQSPRPSVLPRMQVPSLIIWVMLAKHHGPHGARHLLNLTQHLMRRIRKRGQHLRMQ